MPKKSVQPLTKQDLLEALKPIKEELKGFAKKTDLADFAKKSDLVNFATKVDLKNFATKDDLKEFAKKTDLANFATKDDLKVLPTKEYLKEAIETSQESLARIINQGFQETQDMMSKGFKEVNHRLSALEEDREVVERVRDALAIH